MVGLRVIVTPSSTEGFIMKEAIGYLRVSTQAQGRSGLGLAAQRHEIKAPASRGGSARRQASGLTVNVNR